jgi:hypothetical protein
MNVALRGVGLGWRTELAADLLADPRLVDFVEVVAESCMVQPRLRDEAAALTAIWPVLVHGVKLSLGSADGIDDDRAKQLGALAKRLRSPVISEHVAFTRGGAREIGHLTQLPRTRAAVAVVARNVERLRRLLPDVPLLLENVAFTCAWPDDEMDEPTFYAEIVEATGCPLLLDLSNLWANAVNEARDPLAVLCRYPLDRVAMLHLAGGVWDAGFYYDTHAAPIGEPILQLLGQFVARRGPVPMLIERDAEFGGFADLRAELERLRDIATTSERVAWTPPPLPLQTCDPRLDDALATAQRELADALTSLDPPSPQIVQRYGAEPLRRTRAVLQRKRVDDAMPLLPRTSALGQPARDLAARAVQGSARADRRAAIADALRIAAAAAADPHMAAAGRVDELVLRARFIGPDRHGSVATRRGPFVGRTRVREREIWVVKGPGSSAAVRVLSR